MKKLEKELEKIGQRKGYIQFGLRELERALKIPKGEGHMMILGARPGMGKTSLALAMARGFAEIENSNVLYFSMEMSSQEVSKRLLSQESRLKLAAIERPSNDERILSKIAKGIQNIAKLPIYIDDNARLTGEGIVNEIKRFSEEEEIGLVVIDYIQLIGDRYTHLGWRQLSGAINSLKRLSRELDIPIIVCSQVDQRLERRADKRPVLTDLKGPDNIVEDADTVAFLYRDGYYNQNHENRNVAEVNIAKNKRDTCKVASLKWVGGYMGFENL